MTKTRTYLLAAGIGLAALAAAPSTASAWGNGCLDGIRFPDEQTYYAYLETHPNAIVDQCPDDTTTTTAPQTTTTVPRTTTTVPQTTTTVPQTTTTVAETTTTAPTTTRPPGRPATFSVTPETTVPPTAPPETAPETTVPAVAPPLEEAPPAQTLPATGRTSGTTVAIAAATLLAGVAAVAGTRRRKA
jgi:LPXTG-motif cell wall-anchored protein